MRKRTDELPLYVYGFFRQNKRIAKFAILSFLFCKIYGLTDCFSYAFFQALN